MNTFCDRSPMFKPSSICVRLTAAIQDEIGNNFSNLKPWAIVDKYTDNESKIMLMLSNKTGHAFAELDIVCSIDTHEPTIRHIDITGRMRHADGPNNNFDNVAAEQLVHNYRNLGINVVTGTLCQPDKEAKVTKTRTMEVRFTLLHTKINIDELSGRTYEFEVDIAKKAVPYIRAINDIKEQLLYQLVK